LLNTHFEAASRDLRDDRGTSCQTHIFNIQPTTHKDFMMDSVDDKQQEAELILSLMDLTSLNSDDTDDSIKQLIDSIEQNKSLETPAAICVYPQFVKCVKGYLEEKGLSRVKVATVTNFPGGDEPLKSVLDQTRQALSDGADEIDLVLPYKKLLKAHVWKTTEVIDHMSAPSSQEAQRFDVPHLKVIIESGELMNFSPALEMTRVEPGSVAIDSLCTLLKLVTVHL